MTDITTFYPMITECVVNVIRAVIAIVFGVLIIPWIKNSAIPWLKEKQLYNTICKFVRAAEKLADGGIIDKKAKLDYVIGLLAHSGIRMTPEVRALIESAVGELDDEFANNLQNLADAITGAEHAEPIVVEGTVSEDEPCEACQVAPAEGDAE